MPTAWRGRRPRRRWVSTERPGTDPKTLAARPGLREAWRMENLPLTIRPARPADAPAVARVYLESWQDTYPGALSNTLLANMTIGGQTGRWRAAICQGEHVLVAE